MAKKYIDVDKKLPELGVVVIVKLYSGEKKEAYRRRWQGNAWRWRINSTIKHICQGDVMKWRECE